MEKNSGKIKNDFEENKLKTPKRKEKLKIEFRFFIKKKLQCNSGH